VVLDEAQNIKNPKSQTAGAAFSLTPRFPLALSGTPIENRLEELWSILHFTSRGLLGGLAHFDSRYASPINSGDAEALLALKTRIKPFITRRLKSEVAKELPPRTDVVLPIELDEAERNVYDAIHAASRTEVLERLEGGGSVMAALEALMRLRQAACHTGLIPGQKGGRSSKIDALLDALEPLIEDGHKALVFSQWTSLLDRIEPHLTERGTEFLRLDGKTRDRQSVVERFQDPGGPQILLASLKAGGTGLNLTAADHVFILDPWWNPAAEDQAADRAHRIGQTRSVMVYRLVAKDTVEEGILGLQERKRALAEGALGEAAGASEITRADLLQLLG
jgi:SNF2 family DNA or RNA helicase